MNDELLKNTFEMYVDFGDMYEAGGGEYEERIAYLEACCAEVREVLENKQNKLTEGEGIDITEDEISIDTTYINKIGDIEDALKDLRDAIGLKQDTLTPGSGIEIDPDDTIHLDQSILDMIGDLEEQVADILDSLSSDYQPKLTPGENIEINEENVIKAIVDLSNYYNKSEVDALLSGLEHVRLKEVASLPLTGETNVIYLVPNTRGGHEQYIWTEDGWVDIGSDDVDLSDYYNKSQVDTALAAKQDKLVPGSRIKIATDGKTISADAVTESEILTALGYSKMSITQEEDGVIIGRVEVIGKDTTPVPPTP